MFTWLKELLKPIHIHHHWDAVTDINPDGIIIILYYECRCGAIKHILQDGELND